MPHISTKRLITVYFFNSILIPDLNLKIILSSKMVIFSMSRRTRSSSYSVILLDCVSRNSRISLIRLRNISCSAPSFRTCDFYLALHLSLLQWHHTRHFGLCTLPVFPATQPFYGQYTPKRQYFPHSEHPLYYVAA